MRRALFGVWIINLCKSIKSNQVRMNEEEAHIPFIAFIQGYLNCIHRRQVYTTEKWC